jgi:hypothetical protein
LSDFALLIIAFFVVGRLVFRFILGKKGEDEPNRSRSSETLYLERPEGHSLFLEFYGPQEAPPIILIHGWSSNSTQWYYLKKHLSASYRLILLDLPGLGRSGKPRIKTIHWSSLLATWRQSLRCAGIKSPFWPAIALEA